MRTNLNKRSSTKAERRFQEILKRNRIPHHFRTYIGGREVDFVIGNIAIEIGNHSQDTFKNKVIIESGYSLLFISNKELQESPTAVEDNLITNWLKYVNTTQFDPRRQS